MGNGRLIIIWAILFTSNAFAYSFHSLKSSAKLHNISIVTDDSNFVNETHEQLKYITGNLLEYDAGFSVGNTAIDLISKKSINEKQYVYIYNASFELWWPTEMPIPSSIKIVLPLFGDSSNLKRFLNIYEKDCSFKINGQISSFWNYIRPSKRGCPLTHDSGTNGLSKTYNIILSLTNEVIVPSLQNQLIWDDKLFKATIVFGRVEKNFQNGPSTIDLNNLKKYFMQKYGLSLSDKILLLGEDKDIYRNQLIFEKNGFKYEYNLFLVNDFGEEVVREVNKTTDQLDFFSYNGHAGMGINIESIGKHLALSATKYGFIHKLL